MKVRTLRTLDIISLAGCPGDEIGRRSGLKIRILREYGFESRSGHQARRRKTAAPCECGRLVCGAGHARIRKKAMQVPASPSWWPRPAIRFLLAPAGCPRRPLRLTAPACGDRSGWIVDHGREFPPLQPRVLVFLFHSIPFPSAHSWCRSRWFNAPPPIGSAGSSYGHPRKAFRHHVRRIPPAGHIGNRPHRQGFAPVNPDGQSSAHFAPPAKPMRATSLSPSSVTRSGARWE